AAGLCARTPRPRPFEPQAHLCEALALEALGKPAEAALRYEVVLAGRFDPRFERFAKESARRLYGRLLVTADADKEARRQIDERIAELKLPRELPGHEVHLLWNLDDTDVDLHVQESKGGVHVSYRNMRSPTGGELLW